MGRRYFRGEDGRLGRYLGTATALSPEPGLMPCAVSAVACGRATWCVTASSPSPSVRKGCDRSPLSLSVRSGFPPGARVEVAGGAEPSPGNATVREGCGCGTGRSGGYWEGRVDAGSKKKPGHISSQKGPPSPAVSSGPRAAPSLFWGPMGRKQCATLAEETFPSS